MGDKVKSGLCVWRVSVELGYVDFELGVVAVLFEPFLEGADEGVVAVDAVASGGAGGGVLGVCVKWVLAL